MKHRFNRVSSITLAAIGVALAVGSPASHACSDQPVLGSICIMATPATFGSFNRTYQLAAGQLMQINQSTALYSLIGIAYGGDARTNFNLPNLQGKVIIGSDVANYPAGKTGGQASVVLTTGQLPTHNFQVALPIDVSKITATTTLTGLAGTANLSGVTIAGPATGLTIKASGSSAGQTSPSGNYLGKPSATAAIYATGSADSTLNANSISGNLSLTVGPGVTAPVVINSGTAATTLAGTSTVTGNTNAIGSNLPVPTLPPYLAVTYYIAATNGLYPSRD